MTPEHAERVAMKLNQSWPRSNVTMIAWTTALVELDLARAEETCRQLVRTEEHAPSIARFLAKYRDLAGTAGPDPDGACAFCGDSGWVPDTNHPGHWPGRPETIPVASVLVTRTDDDGHVTTAWELSGECWCNVVAPCGKCAIGPRVAERRRRHPSTPAPTTNDHEPVGPASPTMF